MNRTDLAYESGTKLLEHAVGLHERAPESIGVHSVIGAIQFVAIEADRILDFVRNRMNGSAGPRAFRAPSSAAYRTVATDIGSMCKSPVAVVAGLNRQPMIDEVEIDLQRPRADGDR
jgi:hypothetical protein